MKTLRNRRGYSSQYLKRKVNEVLDEAAKLFEMRNTLTRGFCMYESSVIQDMIRSLKKP